MSKSRYKRKPQCKRSLSGNGPADIYYLEPSNTIYVRWTKDGPACALATLGPGMFSPTLSRKLKMLRATLSRSSIRGSPIQTQKHILEILDLAHGNQAHRQMTIFPISELDFHAVPPKLR